VLQGQLWGGKLTFLSPFVSSEVETPIEAAPGPRGISTSLDANGVRKGERQQPVVRRPSSYRTKDRAATGQSKNIIVAVKKIAKL
jgi:hypothetical protein